MLTGDAPLAKVKELCHTEPTKPVSREQSIGRTQRGMTDEPFYRYFAVDYVATGEGRSIFLMICRNYSPIDDKDREYEKFVKFVGNDYFIQCFEELTEREFLDRYTRFITYMIAVMIQKRNQPFFTWQTHLHFNYS